jgi:hypothetical protein
MSTLAIRLKISTKIIRDQCRRLSLNNTIFLCHQTFYRLFFIAISIIHLENSQI